MLYPCMVIPVLGLVCWCAVDDGPVYEQYPSESSAIRQPLDRHGRNDCQTAHGAGP